MLACQKHGRVWAVAALAAREDVDLNARDKNGFTALMWTVSNENVVGITRARVAVLWRAVRSWR